jgi:sugar lactone lactonase YvrE
MRTSLLCFLLVLILQVTAKSQNVDFQKTDIIIGTPVSYPRDVAIDKNGNIYILQGLVINKIDAEGTFLGKISVSPNSFSLEIDTAGNLYTASTSCACVTKYAPSGKALLQFGSYGTGAGQTKSIGRIALDSEGNVYAVDYTNKRIMKYNPAGQFLRYIGASTLSGGTLVTVRDVGVDAQGNVYVLDSSGGYGSITYAHKFSPSGENLKKLTVHQEGTGYNPNDVSSFAVKKDGGLYVVHQFFRDILEYNPDGNLIRKFAGHGPHEGGLFGDAINLKIDGAGNLFAADYHHSEPSIKKYSPTGVFLKKYGRDKIFYSPVYDRMNNLITYESNGKEIHKYDAAGKLRKKFKIYSDANIQSLYQKLLATDSQANIYLLEYGDKKQRIQKFNTNGVPLQRYDIVLPGTGSGSGNMHITNFAIDKSGTMFLISKDNGQIHKLNSEGKYIGTFGINGSKKGELSAPQSISFDAIGHVYIQDFSGNRIQKYSPQGDLLMVYGDTARYRDPNWGNLSVDDYGNAFVSYYGQYGTNIRLYNQTGNLVNTLPIPNYGMAVNKSGSMFAIRNADLTIVVYASANLQMKNYITGIAFEDTNGNCIKDDTEKPIEGIIVAAEPGPYYGITNENGEYHIAVDSGTFSVSQVIAQDLGRVVTQTCSTDQRVELKTSGNTVSGPNFGNSVTLSPYLSVSVSSTRRRRCFKSTTIVRYSNTGFAPSENAKVYLQLPPEVELLSADKAYTRLADGTYEFTIGTVGANQSGTITIQDKVTCGDESVRNRTVCTRAWITPSNNAPSTPTPTITITGQCNYDLGMVRFVVKNTGQADMTDPELFRKYIDGDLSSIEQYRLAAGDSMVLWVPTSGMTVRLEADQPEGNGDNTLASVTVEACRVSATQTGFSTGIVNLMPADEEEAEVSEECLLITDSFDPNDKLVTPVGRTEENYTPTNTALKYKIRFQNTGTDVAYRVVVVDTLSEHLDLSTLQVGAASHAHRLEVSGKGRPVLTWTFDNIMLPDSTADEPNSHGYIQFSIKPKADLPEKTAVENFADIFFDYNSPVRTNVTVNRIYDMPPVIKESVRMDLEDILATPGITSFAPAAGRYGTEVVLSGKKFSGITARNKVYFNNVAAQVLSATATELRVMVPAGAATGKLKVVTPDGAASTTESFQVYQPPVISSFSPAEGIVGSTVTLQGEHLTSELIESVKLGNLNCEIISNAAGTLVVKVPADAVTAKFEALTKGGEALSATAYVVWYQPVINSLSKQTDIVGATITISGQNFATDPARNKVHFGKAQAQVLQATQDMLTVKVPAGAESGFVTVETPGGKANSSTSFEVIPGPQFIAMAPTKGTVGTIVEITGVHFLTQGLQDEVRFNGEKAQVLEASPEKLKVQVPRGTTTGKVQITGFGGVAYSTTDFEVEELAPTEAILVYPNPTTGHFTISLQHADFDVQAIEVYDAVGKLVHTTTVASPRPDHLNLNISLARSGMYTLHIKTDRGTVIKKLTVL